MCSLDCFTGGQLKGYLPKVIEQEQSQEQAKLNSNFFLQLSVLKCVQLLTTSWTKLTCLEEKTCRIWLSVFSIILTYLSESLSEVNYICLLIGICNLITRAKMYNIQDLVYNLRTAKIRQWIKLSYIVDTNKNRSWYVRKSVIKSV